MLILGVCRLVLVTLQCCVSGIEISHWRMLMMLDGCEMQRHRCVVLEHVQYQ